MKITIASGLSEVRNLLDSLYMLYNDNYKKSLEDYNLKPNKAVETALEYLKERVTFNLKHQDLFFKEGIFVAPALVTFEELGTCNSAEDFIKVLKELKEEDMKVKVLEDLQRGLSIGEKDFGEIALDEIKTIDFIRALDLPSSIKWETFDFFQDVKHSLEELVIFLENYIPVFKEVLDNNKPAIEEFNSYLKNKIETEGEAFIKKLSRDAIDFEGVKEVSIVSTFFNSHSLSFNYKDSKLQLYIGLTFEETARGMFGEEQIDVNLNILKNLSDKTRFQIVMLLKDKELYGQEIAEKIGISMATVSYHMSYLLISNLVSIEKIGHKGYYKLNKNTLRLNLDFLKDIFEL